MNLQQIDAEIKRLQDLRHANLEQTIVEVFQKETPEFYFAYEGLYIVLTYKCPVEYWTDDNNVLKNLYNSVTNIEPSYIYINYCGKFTIIVHIELNSKTIPLLAQLQLSPTDMKFTCHYITRSLQEQINERLERIEADKKIIEECKIKIENLTKLREAFSAN